MLLRGEQTVLVSDMTMQANSMIGYIIITPLCHMHALENESESSGVVQSLVFLASHFSAVSRPRGAATRQNEEGANILALLPRGLQQFRFVVTQGARLRFSLVRLLPQPSDSVLDNTPILARSRES